MVKKRRRRVHNGNSNSHTYKRNWNSDLVSSAHMVDTELELQIGTDMGNGSQELKTRRTSNDDRDRTSNQKKKNRKLHQFTFSCATFPNAFCLFPKYIF